MKKIIKLFKSITFNEIVLTLVVSTAIGSAYWGWSLFFSILKPGLKLLGLKYILSGFWIFSAIFLPMIIRKPGVALVGSVVAAFVEGMISQWGLMSVVWGFVQGIGAEFVFFVFFYRRWNLFVVSLASIFSCSLSYVLDYYIYEYQSLTPTFNLIQLITYNISSVFLGGYLSYYYVNRLKKLGLLEQFLVSERE